MALKKGALGRGLSALIEEASEETNKAETVASINDIDINLIEVNPFQPRKTFNEEALSELSISIRELGIIQPITVRQLENGKYQLISGERRFRASQLAGLNTMPAYVRTANDQAMLELALVENIQREDLDAIEISLSYQRLIDECNLTQEILSDRVGKKRSTVANYLRLLRLPAAIQQGIRQRKISMGHAKALINIESPDEQVKIFFTILEDGLSVRQVEELVKALNIPRDETVVIDDSKPVKENDDASSPYRGFRDNLRTHFNQRVEFKRNTKGVGKIVIPFYSDNELIKFISMVEKLGIKE